MGAAPQDAGIRRNAKPAATGRGLRGSSRPGTHRAEADRKAFLWLYAGAGVVALLIVGTAVILGSGESRPSEDLRFRLSRLLIEAKEARLAGDYQKCIDICERILGDERYRRSPRYGECRALADEVRVLIQTEREGVAKVAVFRHRIETSKANGTALKMAREFWDECDRLVALYRTTSAGQELLGIKEDLRRWLATESQSGWQREYNPTKERVERLYVSTGDFAQALREWRRFGGASADPLLHSRIDSEIRGLQKAARQAAERIVNEIGGADARRRIEEASARFAGTEGEAILNQRLKLLR